MTLNKSFLIAALFCANSALAGECVVPVSPPIPNGATANEAEMKAASDAVKRFLADAEDYMKCLEFKGGAMIAEHRRDEAAEQMQKVAAAFNMQVRAFKAR